MNEKHSENILIIIIIVSRVYGTWNNIITNAHENGKSRK